jgi:hypothetical protein
MPPGTLKLTVLLVVQGTMSTPEEVDEILS